MKLRLAIAAALPLAMAAQQVMPRSGRVERGAPPTEAVQPRETPPEERCTVEGQVLNAATGEPLKKANLILRRADMNPGTMAFPTTYSTSTDAGGKFAMKDLEPGKYRLSVNRTGFVSGEYGARGPMRAGATVSLDPGQRLRDLVLKLTPQGVITGRVLDEDGEPVAYVQVQPMRYRYNQGRKQLTPAGGASTNDLGEYRIFGLAPGRYYLSATNRSGMMFEAAVDRSATQQPEEGYVPTYYPGSTDPAAAVAVDVAPGAQLRGMDFTLSKTRTVRVRGRVINSTGNTSRNVMVMLMPRDQMGFFGNMSRAPVMDPQGKFEIRGVAPGSYTLVATLYDSNRAFTARQPVEAGSGGVDNLNVTLTSGFELSGQIRAEGEKTLSYGSVRLSLRPRDGGIMFGPQPNARVNDNGSFTMSDVSPEHYILTVFGLPDGYYVKSVRLGNEEALEAGLNLTRGPGGAIDVVLSPNAGQVEGLVLDAKQQPATGATVVLVPEPKRRDQMQSYKTANTDQYGRFLLKNVEPGEYKLFAWEDVEYGAYMDPDFLKPVESQGHSLSIREGSRESAQLKLIPAEDTPRSAEKARPAGF